MTNAAGYSGTPLAKKLGIASGARVTVVGAPSTYRASLEPLPSSVTFVDAIDTKSDLVHLFTAERATLSEALTRYRKQLRPDAVVWVSWPKKASKVVTDITEDTIREVALPLGFVDIKVCAVDEVWSGLKLVVRKTLR
jgi:Protein of unknown function (DUF3052)